MPTTSTGSLVTCCARSRVTSQNDCQNTSGDISAHDGLGTSGAYDRVASASIRPSEANATALQLLDPISMDNRLMSHSLFALASLLRTACNRCIRAGMFVAWNTFLPK